MSWKAIVILASRIKRTVWILFCGGLFGLIGGLGVGLGILFAKANPFWAIGLTAVFLIFHISDYKRFWKERRFVPIVFRSAIIFSISSFVGGFFWFSTWGYLVSGDDYVILTCILVGFLLVTFRLILWEFFAGGRIDNWINETIDGMRITGVLWRN